MQKRRMRWLPFMLTLALVGGTAFAADGVDEGERSANTVRTTAGRDCLKELPPQLSEFLTDCTLIDGLRPAKIRASLNRKEPLAIQVAGEVFTLDLGLDPTVFSEGAINGIETAGRGRVETKAFSNTFLGSVRDLERSDAGATIAANNQAIYGFGSAGPSPKDQFFFETLPRPKPRRGPPVVLTYRGSDVRVKFVFPEDDTDEREPRLLSQELDEGLTTFSHVNQRIFGLGDLSFRDSLGSNAAAFARMEFLITCITLWYGAFTNVDFQIAELWLHLFDFGPTDATALRDQFADHMEGPVHQPEATYHVAHFFTGVNTDGSTIGKSQFPGPEPEGHYGISQMIPEPGFYDATVFGQGILVAHEVGHNYDATHASCDVGPPPDIMCAGSLGGPETRMISFSDESTALINDEEAVKTTR